MLVQAIWLKAYRVRTFDKMVGDDDVLMAFR